MYFDSETETQIKINTRGAANSTVVPLFNLTVQYDFIWVWVHGSRRFVRLVCPVRVWCGCQIQAGLESRSVGLSQSGTLQRGQAIIRVAYGPHHVSRLL